MVLPYLAWYLARNRAAHPPGRRGPRPRHAVNIRQAHGTVRHRSRRQAFLMLKKEPGTQGSQAKEQGVWRTAGAFPLSTCASDALYWAGFN